MERGTVGVIQPVTRVERQQLNLRVVSQFQISSRMKQPQLSPEVTMTSQFPAWGKRTWVGKNGLPPTGRGPVPFR
jgi:hypothetical protein